MSQVILFGTSNFSLLMKKYIERFSEDVVVGFVCHAEYRETQMLGSLPVYTMEEIVGAFPPCKAKVLPTAGYTKMNTIRAKVVEEFQEMGYEFSSFIHPSVQWYGEKMGIGNIILENTTICMNSTLGSFNILFSGCNISHDVTIGDFNHFSPSAALSGFIDIGNHCFIGTNSTIKNNVEIADFSLIGAGAYIQHSTKEYSVTVPSKSVNLDYKSSKEICL